MLDLPDPETYIEEMKYFPWGKTIDRVVEILRELPLRGCVLDLMCGPGFLLNRIGGARPDLKKTGVDINTTYLEFAKSQDSKGNYKSIDVRKLVGKLSYDAVVCTAGVHHLPYEDQEPFLRRIPRFMKDEGICVIADTCIFDYTDEKSRQFKAIDLGLDYINSAINMDAPKRIIETALNTMHNDVMGYEYKTSYTNLKKMLDDVFPNVSVEYMWIKHRVMGDRGEYVFICKK